MSILLAKNILAMLLMAAMGFALVKSKKLSLIDSESLSILSLYVLTPCMTLSSFQVQMTAEVRRGLLVAFIGSIIAHAVFIALAQGLKRPLGLDEVERVSAVCSNCGAFVVPLISMVLGSEYTIYGVVYFAVLSVTLWTYGTPLLRGSRDKSPRKLLLSVNMIALYLGLIVFFTGIELPSPVQKAVGTVGSMLGPVAMISTGMALAEVDAKKALSFRRLPLVTALRMLVFPLILLVIFKFTPLAGLSPNGDTVLLIVLMGASAPSAFLIGQIAQVYGKDFYYASTISVTTLFLSILSVPFLVFLYQL